MSTRAGSILGAAAAALALCAGPAAAGGQPAALSAAGSALPTRTAGAAAQPDGISTITSASPEAAGKCLDVYDWGKGRDIQMWACHGGSNQAWTISWNGTSGGWNIQSLASHQCVDGSLGKGEQLIQNSCGTGLGQAWKIDSFVGAFRVENIAYPGQCMDIYNWGRSSKVQLWDCGSQANQYWLSG
ncbi:RICIN domain-containing protein [Kitasatospora sp. NPDC001547]|uniref:RICIN domain-containing protein n=1 Tax=Kitasatospora sp. NPDC001547 TaxID=3364015 RepID=UPI0036BEBBD2